jgi:hypothetical protein
MPPQRVTEGTEGTASFQKSVTEGTASFQKSVTEGTASFQKSEGTSFEEQISKVVWWRLPSPVHRS